ncbi:MAG: hypothetical protein R2760_08055 [Chitinophagales bacterium]
MEKLELNNYGVQEMNTMELQETEGGFFTIWRGEWIDVLGASIYFDFNQKFKGEWI